MLDSGVLEDRLGFFPTFFKKKLDTKDVKAFHKQLKTGDK